MTRILLPVIVLLLLQAPAAGAVSAPPTSPTGKRAMGALEAKMDASKQRSRSARKPAGRRHLSLALPDVPRRPSAARAFAYLHRDHVARVDRPCAYRRDHAAPGGGAERQGQASRRRISVGYSVRRTQAADGAGLHRRRRTVRPRDTARHGRLGLRRSQHAFHSGGRRRSSRRGHPSAQGEVDVRLSVHGTRPLEADVCVRSAVRRQPERHRVCARCRKRLHPLDLLHDGRSAHGRRRTRRRRAPSKHAFFGDLIGRVHAVGRGHRQRDLERACRSASERDHHGRARVSPRRAVCARVVARGGHGRSGLPLLHVPRQRRRLRRRERQAVVAALFDRRGAARSRDHQDGRKDLLALRRGRLEHPDGGRAARPPLRRHRQQLHGPGEQDRSNSVLCARSTERQARLALAGGRGRRLECRLHDPGLQSCPCAFGPGFRHRLRRDARAARRRTRAAVRRV